MHRCDGAVAQLGERDNRTVEARGSIPLCSTILPLITSNLNKIFSVDLRSLAALRLGAASLILADLVDRASDLTAFYTDAGVLPRWVLSAGLPHFDVTPVPPWMSLHMLGGSWVFEAALCVIAGACALMLLVGYQTPLAACASWVLLLSLHGRNPFATYRADELLRALVFWGMFLPWSARWSVDRRRDPRLRTLPNPTCSVGTIALLCQVGLLYCFAAVGKSGPDWRDGTAVSQALSLDYFVTPFGVWLRQFPQTLRASTYAVLWFERLVPLLLFCPMATGLMRGIGIAGCVAFQAGLIASLHLGLFPFVNLVAVTPFIPGSWWARAERWVRPGASPR